jgi:cbb3-type cytochrome oxidase subunit 3
MWDKIVELANAGWNVWLLLMFLGCVAYALWPTKKRQREMDHAARIPLDDDEDMPRTGRDGDCCPDGRK